MESLAQSVRLGEERGFLIERGVRRGVAHLDRLPPFTSTLETLLCQLCSSAWLQESGSGPVFELTHLIGEGARTGGFVRVVSFVLPCTRAWLGTALGEGCRRSAGVKTPGDV